MQFSLDESDLAKLDAGQKDALMEALMFAVFADAKIQTSEIKEFEVAVDRIPWGLSREELVERMQTARGLVIDLAKKGDKDPIMARIEQVTSKLSDLGLKVFHAMASIMAADDQLTVEEKNVMIAFVTGFDLSREQIESVKADVKANVKGA